MRFIEVGQAPAITLTDEREFKLKEFLSQEHQRVFDNRNPLERLWRRMLLQYQGRPALEVRNIPYENAPNIEITIGAMHSDQVYAQMIDLIFQVRPALTVRSKGKEYDDIAEGMQRLVDWGAAKSFNFKPAVKNGCLDDVQLGTMVYYTPWVANVRKQKTRTVRTAGPRIFSLPIEDFLVPTNCTGDLQAAKFATMRLWLTKNEMNLRRKMQKWKTYDAKESAEKVDPVREQRLRMSGVDSEGLSKGVYQIMDSFCYFDIDGDGIDEDLEVIWDWTSKNILKVSYNPWDYRPFVATCYQDRAHVFNGLGVMEMDDPYECEITEIHNSRTANMFLANTRGFIGPENARSEVTTIYPGMYISDFGGVIKPFAMADIFPSSAQAEGMTLALAEKRVGTNELTAPMRAGGRPNATTSTQLMQAAQRRFTPAFDNARECLGEVIEQCMYRFQEQVKLGNQDAIKLIQKVAKDKAGVLLRYFEEEEIDLEDVAEIELTAASVSVNRESDRQNMVMLAGLFKQYMEGMTQLEMMKKQMPDLAVAQQGEAALNAIFRRIFRTFDQISDVRSVLIEPSEAEALGAAGLGDVPGAIQGMIGPPGAPSPNGGPPAAEAA